MIFILQVLVNEKVIMNKRSILKKWSVERENEANKDLWKILNLLIKISSICGKKEQNNKKAHSLNLKNLTPQRTK